MVRVVRLEDHWVLREQSLAELVQMLEVQHYHLWLILVILLQKVRMGRVPEVGLHFLRAVT